MKIPETTHIYDISGFVTFEMLREMTGIPQSTLDDRLEALGIKLYTNPVDRRLRMIREVDLERLLKPQPIERQRPASQPTRRRRTTRRV